MPTTPESPLPSSEPGPAGRPRRPRGVLQPATRAVLALLGALVGYQLAERVRASSFAPVLDQGGKVIWLVVFTAAGLLIGYLLGVVLSRLMRRGLDRVDEVMARASGAEVVVAIGGVVVGLFIATLISIALVRIPIVGPYLTVPIYLLAGYFTAYLAAKKHIEILRLLGVRGAFEVIPGLTPAKLLDSSAIIDGRILEIIDTGFVEGELLVPRFVVEELQRLADSADAEKRVRGRRGLDFVKRLQNSSGAVTIDGTDYADIDAVDAKLVRFAKDTGAQIISTDYTLKKVAEIQGVKLLNVNDLANSVKPAVLPGEVIEVKILREGREQDQGVGYLDDGTMIVVEAGSSLVGSRVKAEVTSVLQSPSGKMIFSRVSAPPPAERLTWRGWTWRISKPGRPGSSSPPPARASGWGCRTGSPSSSCCSAARPSSRTQCTACST